MMQGAGEYMTNEELAIKIQQGETELIGVLWDQVHKFVRMMAKRRALFLEDTVVDAEDLYQSGYFALLYAVKSFDPASGYSFITFLTRPLRSSFSEAAGCRTERQRKAQRWSHVSLDATVEGEGATLHAFVPDSSAENAFLEIERKELCRAVSQALEGLTDEQRSALVARYCLKKTLTEEERKREKEALRVLRQKKTLRDLRAYC